MRRVRMIVRLEGFDFAQRSAHVLLRLICVSAEAGGLLQQTHGSAKVPAAAGDPGEVDKLLHSGEEHLAREACRAPQVARTMLHAV